MGIYIPLCTILANLSAGLAYWFNSFNIIAVVAVLLGIAMFTGFFLLLGRGLLEGGKNISDGEDDFYQANAEELVFD